MRGLPCRARTLLPALAATLAMLLILALQAQTTLVSNTGRTAVDNYDLRYRQGTSGGWINGPQNVTGTRSTIMSPPANTRYQVQVLATNDEGDSPWSPPGDGQPSTADNTAPEFPSATADREVAENTAAGQNVGAALTATDGNGESPRAACDDGAHQ
ncbi:MAG: fibronectin type III domain-containing protein [Spirochaetaceae bacterium]|nr:fibronectin type III domain-containing protein [Spirochaetaceae bacterium]